MFRARLASVVVAASLAASSGCHVFDHPLFGCGHRDGCCPAPVDPCCNGGFAGSSPVIQGPILAPSTPAVTPMNPSMAPTTPFVPSNNGQLPLATQPRLQSVPLSTPMPYTP